MQSNELTPFFGFVEDLKDPEELGRVRVRATGYHTQNKGILPTEHLNWFIPVNKGESLKGKGETPKFEVGSLVFGYFIDTLKMNGIVMGTLNGYENNDDKISELNKLARNKNIDETIVKIKNDNRKKGIGSTSFEEPESPYKAQYPYNDVKETKAGHIVEFDNTEGAERIHEYHKSGTYREIHADGKTVYKIVTDNYTIIAGDNYFCVDGNSTGFVGGNNILDISGENTINIKKDNKVNIEGSETRIIGGSLKIEASNIEMNASSVKINGEVTINGNTKVNGNFQGNTVRSLATDLDLHIHGNGNNGSPTTPAI